MKIRCSLLLYLAPATLASPNGLRRLSCSSDTDCTSFGSNYCCSQWGYCGTGGSYCSGAAGPPPPPPPPPTAAEECAPGWTPAEWTSYTSYAPCCHDSPNYDPTAPREECDLYGACNYLGDFAYIGHKSFSWVQRNNIVAFFSTYGDMSSFSNKQLRISALGKTVEALVADTCGDGDCNGCCTNNSQPSGYLIDMEYWTVVNNFGSSTAASGQICWQLASDGPPQQQDCCSWDSGASCPGDEWCDASKSNCEGACEGHWTGGSTSNGSVSNCCSWDSGESCPGDEWCDASKSNCEGACEGHWAGGSRSSNCCSWDSGASCPGDEWCDESESNCEGACQGSWVS